jgi:hypothetical protein
MKRRVRAERKRELGASIPTRSQPRLMRLGRRTHTTTTFQGKHEEAEGMEREVLGLLKRTLGAEHPGPGPHQGKYVEGMKCSGRGEAPWTLRLQLHERRGVRGPG